MDLYQKTYYDGISRVRWAMNIRNQKADYIFLGTSRMANTVDMNKLDSTLGTRSINIATAASSYGENYAIFDHFLKNGNSAHTLVLTFDLFKSIQRNKDKEAMTPLIFKNFDFFPWIDSAEIKEVYMDHSEPWKITMWKYLPISRYVEFNHYIKADSALRYISGASSPKPNFNTVNGKQLNTRPGFAGKRKSKPATVQLGPRGEKYLFKILDRAHKQGLRIILLTAPYFDAEPFDRTQYNALLDTLHKRYQTEYLDFSAMPEWKNPEYFTDVIHINHLGSVPFTARLCDSLKCLNQNF